MSIEQHSLTCPCCGYKSIDGDYEFCEICIWYFDGVQHHAPDENGPNPMTLRDAQRNFRQFGWKYAKVRTELDAMDEPIDRFLKDPEWRPIDAQ